MKVSVTDTEHRPTGQLSDGLTQEVGHSSSLGLCCVSITIIGIALITLHRKNEKTSWKVASEKQSSPFTCKKEKELAFGVWEKIRYTSSGTINHSLASSFLFFLSKHIYIVAQQSRAFFFPGISKIIWKEIDHTHYAASEKTRSSLPCTRLQMKYKSNINRNSWQLEFRKC